MIKQLPFREKSFLHDYDFFSIFYGEAFLFGDFLYYFDGIDARIMGYDQHGEAITDNELNKLLGFLVNKHKPKTVSLECPANVKKAGKFHYKKNAILIRPNRKFDYELIIHRETINLTLLKRKNIRFNIERFDIQFATPTLTYEHILLIDKFTQQWGNEIFYKAEFISSIYFLQSRTTSKIINCYYNQKLVGFCIASTIEKFGLLHYLVTLNEVNGISDILYYESLNFLLQSGLNTITLGFSLNKGLYNFKKKWGGIENWKGSYEILFYNNKQVSQYLWSTRIARRN